MRYFIDPIDPQEELDYSFDWSLELGSNTISTSSWTVENAVQVGSDNTDKQTFVRIREAVLGTEVSITNTITDNSNQRYERTAKIRVEQR